MIGDDLSDGGRIHASCVAFQRPEAVAEDPDAKPQWAGVLIRAPSCGGKSSFALRLIALGARLVADDQVLLESGGEKRVQASAPAHLLGLIEARGLGVLRLPALPCAPVAWIVELRPSGAVERLPPRRKETILGVELPVLGLSEGERAAAALCCLVRDGALLDPEANLAEWNGAGRSRGR